MSKTSMKIEEMFSVSGKVVAVTGAAGIIYGTVSKALGANGAKVALLDIQLEKVQVLAQRLYLQEWPSPRENHTSPADPGLPPNCRHRS